MGMKLDMKPFLLLLNDSFTLLNARLSDKQVTKYVLQKAVGFASVRSEFKTHC
jgi:hypothetical protein